MIELAASLALEPPAILAPQEIGRKKGKSRGGRTAIAIGALIILDDGSECVVAAFDKNGNVLCRPPE